MEVQAGEKRQSKFTAQQFKEYLQYSDKSLGNLFYQSHNETKTWSYLLQVTFLYAVYTMSMGACVK